MRTFALLSNKTSENNNVKQRVNWSEERLKQALLSLKQTCSMKTTAKELNLTTESLKRALSRRGYSMRGKLSRGFKRDNAKARSIYISHSNLNPESPFIAQAAFENKPINGCSWPIGDLNEGNFKFCGLKRANGSYCHKHYNRAYVPTAPMNELSLEGYI